MNDSHVRLREGRLEDLGPILTLERATALAPHWPEAAYAAILRDQSATAQRCLMVAVDFARNLLVGFAVGLLHPSILSGSGPPEMVAELESVAVDAAARRAGIGRALCCEVLHWGRSRGATEAVLEVRATSGGAIALYVGLGFAEVGRRPRYYHGPLDDALLMRLKF